MAKNLAQIKADYQYTDKTTGEVKDRTINTPHYFRDIPRIYSPNLENGYMDFCPKAQKLYCYFQGWENSGNFCYESQEELGKVIDLSRERTCKLIKKLQDAGLSTQGFALASLSGSQIPINQRPRLSTMVLLMVQPMPVLIGFKRKRASILEVLALPSWIGWVLAAVMLVQQRINTAYLVTHSAIVLCLLVVVRQLTR